MATDQAPKKITGDTKKKITNHKHKELTAQTSAMLESQEVKAISGDNDEWWCPNPECKIVDE